MRVALFVLLSALLLPRCGSRDAVSTEATGAAGGGSGGLAGAPGGGAAGESGTSNGGSAEAAGGAASGAAGFDGIGGEGTYACDGTKCVSRLIGLFSPSLEGSYHLDLQIEGLNELSVDCPSQGMDAISAIQFQCSDAKFYFYTPNPQSPLATGDAQLNATVTLSQNGTKLVDAVPTAFTFYEGPYYDSADSPNAGCGGAPCYWHQASFSP